MAEATIGDIHSEEDLNRISTAMDVLGNGSNMGAMTQCAITMVQLVLMESLNQGITTGAFTEEEVTLVETSIAETLRDLADNLENKRLRPQKT